MMTDLFLERTFDLPLSAQSFRGMVDESGGCFARWRVSWQRSFLSSDGRRLVCRLSAPDAESARNALRQAGSAFDKLWPGTIHDAPDPPPAPSNVMVTRTFEQPVTLDEIQAIEDAGAWCLATHQVKFERTFFSRDRRRMVCLYHAPDAESVRLAQRQAEMPVDLVWAFRRIEPEQP